MNVEIGAEAAHFPEKEYINGIDVAVKLRLPLHLPYTVRYGVQLAASIIFFYSSSPRGPRRPEIVCHWLTVL